MYASSSLSEAQRAGAVALFEAGYGHKAVASRLQAGRRPIQKLHGRWRILGSGTLVTNPTKRTFSFEFKLDMVRQAMAGGHEARPGAGVRPVLAPAHREVGGHIPCRG